MFDKVLKCFARFLFMICFLVLFLAVWDEIIQRFGWRVSWIPLEPVRLLEIASTLLIFVIALLLREIRDNTRPGNS